MTVRVCVLGMFVCAHLYLCEQVCVCLTLTACVHVLKHFTWQKEDNCRVHFRLCMCSSHQEGQCGHTVYKRAPVTPVTWASGQN